MNVWLVPEIRDPVRETLDATPNSFYGKIVDDKIADEEPSVITQILIGLVQIGLVLLAPATGGLTLIPATAISVATAYEHFKEYQLKKAMKGTDFGAAALSSEDPSLFWLAADIVGAGFDILEAGGVAFRLFRALAPAGDSHTPRASWNGGVRNFRATSSRIGQRIGQRIVTYEYS